MANIPEIIPTDPKAVKPGHLMAFMYYAHVVDNDRSQEKVNVKDTDRDDPKRRGSPMPFSVQGDALISAGLSADYFAREEKLSQSDIIDILRASYNEPLTVHFEEKDGTPRTLRGRKIGLDDRRGRSVCEDLDIPDRKNRIRQVDHRSLEWLIVRGVKYVVK